MYNYKIDEACTSEVVYVCEKDVGSNIMSVINNIITKIKDIGVDGADLHMSATRFVGKNLVINESDAFTDEQLSNYNLMDKEYTDSINVIQFQLNSLSQQKQRAIIDFDIAKAVSITDKMADLNVVLAGIHAEISKVNGVIKDIEMEFNSKYEEFIAEINGNKSEDDVVSKYDETVVNSYFYKSVCGILDEFLKNLSREEIVQVFDNDEIKTLLGENYQKLVSSYLENVGTDNQSCDQ